MVGGPVRVVDELRSRCWWLLAGLWCWRGETGKRDGIANRWAKALVGSIPTASTRRTIDSAIGWAYYETVCDTVWPACHAESRGESPRGSFSYGPRLGAEGEGLVALP